jgi:hypothetical protein
VVRGRERCGCETRTAGGRAQAQPKREKRRNDPKLVAAAREWRDRYLEELNTGRLLLVLESKYDVSKAFACRRGCPSAGVKQVPLLEAA